MRRNVKEFHVHLPTVFDLLGDFIHRPSLPLVPLGYFHLCPLCGAHPTPIRGYATSLYWLANYINRIEVMLFPGWL